MLVRESILNETYESIRELKSLSKQIIFDNDFEIDKFYNIKDLIKNIENYKVLKNFINSGVGLIFEFKEPDDSEGSYYESENYDEQPEKEMLYKNFPLGFIVLFIDKENWKTVREKWDQVVRSRILVHEFQHAYDDFRSNRKYAPKVFNARSKNDSSQEKINYFRSNHELSAYFTEKASQINFIKDDKFIDFRLALSRFKDNLMGMWHHLTPKIQKNLIRKISQYYYKLKEEFEKDPTTFKN